LSLYYIHSGIGGNAHYFQWIKKRREEEKEKFHSFMSYRRLGEFIASHKVVQEVRVSVLVAAGLHILCTENFIVRMILLPLELFPLSLL